MIKKEIIFILLIIFTSLFLFYCSYTGSNINSIYTSDSSSSSELSSLSSESSSSASSFTGAVYGDWTWLSGSDILEYSGIYGTMGIPDKANIPGPRRSGASWTDNSGNFWLFGGWGFDGETYYSGYLNDLWKFDGTCWTWVSGSDVIFQNGNYGIKGTPDSNNIPGARDYCLSWTDNSGNFWLFGGSGLNDDGMQISGLLNDLWKFEGSDWTWISGTNLKDQAGIYGCLGVPDKNNIPGGRAFSSGWIDKSGNLWLFGGTTTDIYYDTERRNDLWKFDGTNWTWVSGSKEKNQSGHYGLKGVADSSNVPGARECPSVWYDSSGNAWLFGGYGFDKSGNFGCLNDLWKFDGTDWIWISGSDAIDQTGSYGIKGISNITNIPGSRGSSISWIDDKNNLWLLGGTGRDYTIDNFLNYGFLNDLWKFNGTSWTWVSGSNKINSAGIYGIKGSPDSNNTPGGRDTSFCWSDKSGNLWLFGGYGYSSNTTYDYYLNDLWKYTP